jgi:hypothetical protein
MTRKLELHIVREIHDEDGTLIGYEANNTSGGFIPLAPGNRHYDEIVERIAASDIAVLPAVGHRL